MYFPHIGPVLLVRATESGGFPDEAWKDDASPIWREEECCGQYAFCDGLTFCDRDGVLGPLPPDTACLARGGRALVAHRYLPPPG